VEYPLGQYPAQFRQFTIWGDIITIHDGQVPDGTDCAIYYGELHTLNDETSTIPAQYEELTAEGAAGYAAMAWAVYGINRVNVGGEGVNNDWEGLGKMKLEYFRGELRRLSRKNRVRIRRMYLG
jgi:hypothetical protein